MDQKLKDSLRVEAEVNIHPKKGTLSWMLRIPLSDEEYRIGLSGYLNKVTRLPEKCVCGKNLDLHSACTYTTIHKSRNVMI